MELVHVDRPDMSNSNSFIETSLDILSGGDKELRAALRPFFV